MVKEGTTIVIGGLRRDEEVETKEQTPFLSSIPLIGNMFKSGNKKIDRTELMILLTPRIITGDVLVTPQGRTVGHPGIKERRAYERTQMLAPSAATLQAAASAQDRPAIKGLRVTR